MKEYKQFQRTEDGHLLLMTNEERNLLITDLTARLNYGVICLIERVDDFGPIHRNEKLTGFSSDDRGGFYFEVCGGLDISFAEKIMPYLRPMSSMTEEELLELYKIAYDTWYSDSLYYKNEEWITFRDTIQNNALCFKNSIWLSDINKIIDWLNAHHFDYRGLIEKGLALEAPEGMYNFEK